MEPYVAEQENTDNVTSVLPHAAVAAEPLAGQPDNARAEAVKSPPPAEESRVEQASEVAQQSGAADDATSKDGGSSRLEVSLEQS
jgi:hypothetical protein